MYFRLLLVLLISSLLLKPSYAIDEALERFLSHPLVPLLDSKAKTNKPNLKIYEAYKNLDCPSIIKNIQLSFQNPETLFCLDEKIINSTDIYDDSLLISIVDHINNSNSPLKKVFFEEFLLQLFSTNNTVEHLAIIEHLLDLGVSTKKVRSIDAFSLSWDKNERNLILDIFSRSTNTQSRKIDIANQLFQRNSLSYIFNLDKEYLFINKAISLINAGAETERLNAQIFHDFEKLNCQYAINKKQLQFDKPETLLCLSRSALNSPEKYTDELLISVINELNKSNHPLKKAFFANLLATISSEVAVQRFAVTKHLFNIGASPENIQIIEEGLGNEELCTVRSEIYDFQHEYLNRHSLPPVKIDLGYMMDTNSCHRVVCNEVIIKMVNRNKKLQNVGSPVANMLGEFALTGNDLKLLSSFVTPENVNSRGENGQTALEMLVGNGLNHNATAAMKLLIDMGADIYLKNKEGISANDTIKTVSYLDKIKRYADKVIREKLRKK